MKKGSIPVVLAVLLAFSTSCCKDTGKKFTRKTAESDPAETELSGPNIIHNRLLDYGFYRSKPGKFEEDAEAGVLRVSYADGKSEVLTPKPGETLVPIAVHKNGFYYGKFAEGSDAMEVIFRRWGGADESKLTLSRLNDILDKKVFGTAPATDYLDSVAVSANGRYFGMFFWSGTLIAAGLDERKELGRYDLNAIMMMSGADSPPIRFAITDDGTFIWVWNHVATVSHSARVWLLDMKTGVHREITPAGARTACIGGADEPVLAVEFKKYDKTLIPPFQDWEGGGENWHGPATVVYYPDLREKPVPAAKASASSTLIEDPGDPGRFAADRAFDGDPTTAWVEGAAGAGVGEWLAVKFPVPFSIESITVFGGYGASEAEYLANARPKILTITAGKRTFKARIPQKEYYEYYGTGYTTVWFEEPVVATEIKITVEKVHAGTKYEDCCISDVAFGFER